MSSNFESHFPFWRVGLCVKALQHIAQGATVPEWDAFVDFELTPQILNFLNKINNLERESNKLFLGISKSFDEWLDNVEFFSLPLHIQSEIWKESPIHTFIFWKDEFKNIVVYDEA